jgi:hypothetical protein
MPPWSRRGSPGRGLHHYGKSTVIVTCSEITAVNKTHPLDKYPSKRLVAPDGQFLHPGAADRP